MANNQVGVSALAIAVSTVVAACGSYSESGSVGEEGRLAEQRDSLGEPLETPIAVGEITTYAGKGPPNVPGGADNVVATLGTFNDPAGIAAGGNNVWVADWGNNAIRQLSGATPSLSTLVAGRPNLLVNPRGEDASAESGIAGWTVSTGEWRLLWRGSVCGNAICGHPYDGTYWFSGGPVTDAVLLQRVPVWSDPNVAAGTARYHFSAMVRGNTEDQARVRLLCINRSGSSCGTLYNSDWINPPTWTPVGADVIAPTNAHRLMVFLETHALRGSSADAYFDAVQLRALRPTGATASDLDKEILGPAAIGVLGGGSGNLLVGGEGLWTVAQSTGATTKLVGSNGYVMPLRVSSIAVVGSTNRAYIVDPTDPLLHARSHTGKSYRLDVTGVPNGEPLAVAAKPFDASSDLVWVTFRGYPKVYQYKCPLYTGTADTTAITTCVYENVALGWNGGFADDMDGEGGGERFRQGIYGLAIGLSGDLFIAEDYNNAVRRNAGAFTLTIGGGTRGYLDGERTAAQFWGPTGLAVAPGTGDVLVADRNNNVIRKIRCGASSVCGTPISGCATVPTDDQNPCTSDSCLVLAVRHDAVADGTLCSDSNVCTGADPSTERCATGVCVSGPAISTDDGNACTTDTCNPAAGVQHVPVANGTACTDGTLCTSSDACMSGACAGSPVPLDDGKVCTVDSCDPATGVKHVNVANGTSCNDNNACTTNDACATGNCTGSAVPVDDANLCTIDTCDPATGVSHTLKTFPDSNTTDCLVPICNPQTGLASPGPAPEGMLCGPAGSNRRCDHAGVCEASAPIVFNPPPLDAGKGTTFDDLTGAVWKGAGAIQTGIATTKIEAGRAAWLIGRVKTAAGNDLANATVSIASDPSYGTTKTRADGRFDLVVNGGRSYAVRFEKPGHLPVDRQVYAGWEETSYVPDAVMLVADAKPTTVAFNQATGTQTFTAVTGTTSVDADGVRTGQLMIPKGTSATVAGSGAAASLTLRITEYTVGSDGPARMPAPLPPTSAYTYAVELSADEANGQRVQFNKPVYYYVENFVNAAVENRDSVPSGYYDRDLQTWVPAPNGRVVRVLTGWTDNVSAATVDVTGDGVSDDVLAGFPALGFTAEELTELQNRVKALKYEPGRTLWRMPIDHMTPWDFNYGASVGCDADCQQPLASDLGGDRLGCESTQAGSIIGCESQSLGEKFDVAGTPFHLSYQSDRAGLYANWRVLRLGVRTIPERQGSGSWVAANIHVAIAGRVIYENSFGPGLSRIIEIPWDGNDAFGRAVIGSATATVYSQWYGERETLEYVGQFGGPPASAGTPLGYVRTLRPFSRSFRRTTAIPGSTPRPGQRSWSLGGWTLSPHHYYDAKTQLLYKGSGETKQVAAGLYTVQRVAGAGVIGQTGFAPDDTSATAAGTGIDTTQWLYTGLAVAPNGDVYYSAPAESVIRRVNSRGLVKTIAGKYKVRNGTCSVGMTDGSDAVIDGRLSDPDSLAFGRDGELYVWDASTRTIRSLWPTGEPEKFRIYTVAGTPCASAASFVENQQAKGSALPTTIAALAVGPDGDVYFADRPNKRIRRFSPWRPHVAGDTGGKITTVAGDGNTNFKWQNDRLATTVSIPEVYGLAVGRDGTVYVAGQYDILRVSPDGMMRMVTGGYPSGPLNAPVHDPYENVSARSDYVEGVSGLAAMPDGSIVFGETRGIRRNQQTTTYSLVRAILPDGTLRILSQNATPNGSGPADGVSSLLGGPPWAKEIAVAPDGSVLALSSSHESIYRISKTANVQAICQDEKTAHMIPDGEVAYCFDATGRHLRTANWRTGKALYTFSYSATGGLESIKDADDRLTLVADVAGGLNVIAPYQQKTLIALNGDGNATRIQDVGGARVVRPNPDPSGLLRDFTDGAGSQFTFRFEGGLLTEDASPLSVVPQKLSRVIDSNGFTVTHTTPLNRLTSYKLVRGREALNTVVPIPNNPSQTITEYRDFLERFITLPDETQRRVKEYRDGATEVTAPDGTMSKASRPLVDPIWGQRAGAPGTRTTKLPGGAMLTIQNVSCPPQTTSGITTQYSASAENPATPLQCNPANAAAPLANQPSPNAFTNPDHTAVKRVWSTSGETIVTTSPEGRTQTELRDAKGRVTSTQLGNLTPWTFAYYEDTDAKGKLKSTSRGARTTDLFYRGIYETDATQAVPDLDAGFVKRIKFGLTGETTFTRDAYGNALSVVEAPGVADQRGTTGFAWDGNGNLKKVQPPGRPEHNLLYSAINTVSQYTPPAIAGITAPQTSYTPTADRQAATETRPDGVTITNTYITSPKNTEQLDTMSFSGGTSPAGILDYDYYPAAGPSAGKLSALKGPYGNTQLAFDYDGALPTKVTWSGDVSGFVAWSHNARLRPASETTSPGGASYFGYDKDGLLACVSQSGTVGVGANCQLAPIPATDIRLLRSAEHGNVSEIRTGNMVELIDYSDSAPDGAADTDVPNQRAFGELRRQKVMHGDVVLAELTYDSTTDPRDSLGRISVKTEGFRSLVGPATFTNKELEYQYDERQRLEGVLVDGGASIGETFGYDANGNRTSYSGPTGAITSANTLYDAQDRLKTYGNATFTYGANGEIRTKTVGGAITTYTYDALGNLIQVQRPGGLPDIEYGVDGLGRRISKKVGGTVTRRWLYRDSLNPVAELNGAGALVARFVYGSRKNVPDLVIRDGKTYRVVVDQLGSPRLVVDVSTLAACTANVPCASIPYRADYSAFGEATWRGEGPNALGWLPFGFAGGLYDPDTGLVRFGARDYDASIGRWVSRDPSLFRGGVNLYVYSKNDPVNYVDPNGRWFLPAVAVGVGVAAVGWGVYLYYNYYQVPLDIADKSGLPGAWNGQQDAYRHCLASCMIVQDGWTEEFAEGLGNFNERGGPPAECAMDEHNNAIGRTLGSGSTPCETACLGASLQNAP